MSNPSQYVHLHPTSTPSQYLSLHPISPPSLYVDHPAEWCYRLPQGLSWEEGAMVEPLSGGEGQGRPSGMQRWAEAERRH